MSKMPCLKVKPWRNWETLLQKHYVSYDVSQFDHLRKHYCQNRTCLPERVTFSNYDLCFLVCPGLKIIKSAHKQHCQKFYLSLSKVEVPDAKHTTSLLLQNMLDRLMVLEKQVENVVSQSALDISKLSEKVKSLNESLRSFAGNLTWGMYCMHVHNQ